jgi:hypothetical protein
MAGLLLIVPSPHCWPGHAPDMGVELLKMRTDHPVRYEKVTVYTMNVSMVHKYFLAHPPKYAGLTVFFQHEHNLYLSGPGEYWTLFEQPELVVVV